MTTFILIIAFVGYAIVQMYIAYLAKRGVKGPFNLSEFFLGGRKLGTFVLTLTMGATLYSGLATFGLPGVFYRLGIGFYYMPVAKMAFTILGITIGVRIWQLGQRFNFITPTEIFATRYDSDGVRVIAGILFLMLSIFHIGVQSMAAGLAFSSMTKGQIPEWLGASIFVIIVLVYVIIGGLRAVAWTDVVQGLLLLFGMWFCALMVVFSLFGSPSAFMSQVATKFPKLLSLPGPAPVWTYSRLISGMAVAALGMPLAVSMFQRWYMARSATIIKRTSLVLPLWMGFSCEIPMIIIAFGARLLLPQLKRPDMAFAEMMMNFFPVWMSAIFIIAALAAMMSTVDSFLLTNSSIIVEDFLRRFTRWRTKSEAFLVRVSQVVIVLIMLFSIWWAIAKPLPYVFDAALKLLWPGQLQLVPALFAALYWKRGNKYGAITSILGGLLVVIAYHQEFGFLKAPYGVDPGILGLVVGLILMVAVSVVTRPDRKELLDEWYGHLRDTTPDLKE